MKDIRFLQIKFFSYKKKTGRVIDLDNDIVIIKGGNQSGRSSILMSLYSTLGADIKTFSPQWISDNIVTLLKVTVDGIVFQFLHIGKEFYVFDLNGKLYYKASNRQNNASQIAKLFGFNLTFTVDSEEKTRMPVEFMFMPFYVSQDKGWDQPLRSFDTFNVYNGKRNALFYYIGVLKDDFFLICNNLDEAYTMLRKINSELEYDKEFSDYVKNRLEHTRISINPSDFEKEQDDFVKTVERLKKEQGQLMTDLKKTYDRKAYLEYRKQQMHDNFKEIEKDLKYALMQKELLTCPMCGAHVKNDAVGAYMMIQDKNQCKNAIIEYENEIDTVQTKIEGLESKTSQLRDEIAKVEETLSIKKSGISLKEVIVSEMYKYLEQTLTDRESSALKKRNEIESKIRVLSEKAKLYNDNDFKDFVEEDFQQYVIKALRSMDLGQIYYNAKQIKFGSKITTGGSIVSKFIVAYTYAYCELIRKYDGKLFCPIVIDETNQNGIDQPGLKAINSFLIDKKPERAQLILSINNDVDIKTDKALVVELQAGNELLIEKDFKEVSQEVETLLGENFELIMDK